MRRLRLVAYIQRTLLVVLLPNGGRKWLKIIRIAYIQRTRLLLAELSQVSSTRPNRAEGAWYKSVIQ